MANNPSSSSVLTPEGAKPIAGKTQTADEINDLFNDIDSETPTEEERTPPRETKKETKEVKEEEEETAEEPDDIELSEPDEDIEKLDLKDDTDIEVGTPPRKKEILKKFPELFKEFPFLEKMMYRDREYTQLFGSFDDARELADKAEIFNNFETQLLSGNTETILKEVKEADQRAFDIIVDDYLPTLAKVDKDAYLHVVGNLNRRLIMEMVQEAADTNDEDLKQAALIVNKFIFGTAKFTAPTARVDRTKETEEKSNEAEQERLAFVKERFEGARDELQTKVDNTLRATISDYIDPRGTMSSYVKKNAVNDAMNILRKSIADDPSVPKNLDTLWRAAFDSKFSKNALDKIQAYYLSRAKRSLKDAIIKARAEALKDARPTKERDKETDDREEEEDIRRPARRIQPGRPSQEKQGKNVMRKGESVADFFARD